MDNLILDSLRKLPSPMLASTLSKAKIELMLRAQLAFNMESIDPEAFDHIIFEYSYNRFPNIKKKMNKLADMVILDKDSNPLVVVELKHYFVFNIKSFEKWANGHNGKAVKNDIHKLKNVQSRSIKKFLLLFLTHYNTVESPAYFKYDLLNNNLVADWGVDLILLQANIKSNLSRFFKEENLFLPESHFQNLHIGNYRGVPIHLFTSLVEVN